MTARSPERQREIYLDNNASTRVLPVAVRAAQSAMDALYGNPSSSHITGLRARHILELARRRTAAVLGAGDGRIIFTSGATEAIQMAILCALREAIETRGSGATSAGRLLLYGATEHKAVPEALRHWNRLLGVADEVVAIPVDGAGRLDLRFLSDHVARADMVCTMAVNNETGVIQDLVAVESAIRSRNPKVRWLVDCVQAVGKRKLDLAETTIDYAAASGHKIYAPKGVGVLYVRAGSPVTPLIAGGGQEEGARAGTENLPGVAALGAIFGCLLDPADKTFQPGETLAGYRDRLVASLRRAFPAIVFNAPFETTVPTTINFSVKGFTSMELLDLFDAAGIRVSSGSACGSALVSSYVLEAMGAERWRSEGAIRISFGPATEASEIETACRIIEEAGEALRGSCMLVTNDFVPEPGVRQTGVIQLKRGSNCSWIYLSRDVSKCIIVDPIAEVAERIENFVRCHGCRVIAVLDTHDHNDRPSCRGMLVELLGKLAADARTPDFLGWPERADGTIRLGDGGEGEFLRLSDGEIVARTPLPGHTVEGRAYLVGIPEDGTLRADDVRFAFTGDTVLIGGLGRTDFEVSAVTSLFGSLHRLPRLISERTILCPTHDYTNDFCTTLAAEKRERGLLREVLHPSAPISRDEFVSRMRQMDTEIESDDTELICGLIRIEDQTDSSIDVGAEDLPTFFGRHRDSLIVDVREMQEARFSNDWESFGLTGTPENVPMTRFTDFIARLLEQRARGEERDVVLLCRSGTRSGRAAAVLRRLGVPGAFFISGGLASRSPAGV
jgi:cysteine sulfinate desulfinase/cysteine desulfurase-like protein/glyoxylase-like metal-dependent hydrolase (beta-lactamase superfamily II)/rhodanese-related sulfurtransferase